MRASWPGVDCDVCIGDQKGPHASPYAPLTETGWLRLARCVVEDGWPLRPAAERFQVSPTTGSGLGGPYRALGEAAWSTAPARPHHSPACTPPRTERRIIKVRVLTRFGRTRLDRATGQLYADTNATALAS